MSRTLLSAVAFSILTIACTFLGQSSQLTPTKERDLNRYEKIGPYVIELGLDTQARAKIEARIREFLWTHWYESRLGHAEVTVYSKEGEPSTVSYFVEPNERGLWRMAVRVTRTRARRGESRKQRNESVEYEAFSVERIEAPKDGLKPRVVIPRDEMRAPQSYRLVLKDTEGKSLTEI